MKTILYISVSLILLLSGCKSQTQVSDQARQVEQEILFQQASEALAKSNFVLEADRVFLRRGAPFNVNSNTNFISLQGDKAVIQLAISQNRGWYNGIGGVTLEGRVSNVRMNTDKKGNINYTMSVTGKQLSAKVSFMIIKDTNKCTAMVTPNLQGEEFTFNGYLFDREDSSVFKGLPL